MAKFGKVVVKRKLRDGKGRIMGVQIMNARGESRRLLSPAGKSAKYAEELKKGYKLRNDRTPRRNKNGKVVRLSDAGKAWRGGYLQAGNDSARVYRSKHKNY